MNIVYITAGVMAGLILLQSIVKAAKPKIEKTS
jgi:hypothetical protein